MRKKHPPREFGAPSNPFGEPSQRQRGTGALIPQAEERELLPRLSRAAPDGGQGADRGDPGGLHPGYVHLDPYRSCKP